jgi:hypothetical protein
VGICPHTHFREFLNFCEVVIICYNKTMDKFPELRPERESFVKHRRDFNLNILFPVILAVFIVLGLAVLAIFGATGSSPAVSLWADIAAIWVIIPMMFLMLVIVALTGAIVYGMNRLLKVSPRYTGLAQEYVLWFAAEVRLWADRAVKPVLIIRSWSGIFQKKQKSLDKRG